jgi:hypothetical protein
LAVIPYQLPGHLLCIRLCMKAKLKSIEDIVKTIIYAPTVNNVNKACLELKTNIENALLIIPGFYENIRLIKALNRCILEIQNSEQLTSESERKITFKEIQIYMLENLSKTKLNIA